MNNATIRRIIHRDIRPPDCHYRWSSRKKSTYSPCYYDAVNKVADVATRLTAWDPWEEGIGEDFELRKIHAFLHEICHHLTWNPEWCQHGKYIYTHPTIYLTEYKAEKLLRSICRRYQWWSVLSMSDSIVKRIAKKPKPSRDYYGWTYGSRRICREEYLIV